MKKKYLLGRGCYGTCVYVGILQDGTEVAVKTTSKQSGEGLAENEQIIFKRLNNNDETPSFIVSYRDRLTDRYFTYLILDLCEESLDKHVESQNIEHLRTHGRRMIWEILSGLQFLHGQEILHRDLKPQNILVDVEGHMKLADFGISRVLREDESSLLTFAKGTKQWMAAEVINHSSKEEKLGKIKVHYKKKSDVQSAGMISFFILTKGEHPFGSTSHDRIKNIAEGKPVDLDKLEDCDGREFVSRLIAHEIGDRPYAHEALLLSFMASLENEGDV